MRYESADEVLGTLVDAYYEKRDIEAILSCVTDDIEWVGTENDDSAYGKDALRKLLSTDMEDFPDAFAVEFDEPSVKQLGSNVVLFTVTGKQVAVPGVIAGFDIRGTACAVKTVNGWLITSVHTSVPNSEIEKLSLKKELDKNRKREQTLLAGIPGGVAIYRLKKDGLVYTDYVSDGLAKMCGYDTGEEFRSVLKDNALGNLVEEDIPLIQAAMQKNLENHQPISVMYRIHTKAGKDILQRLDANLMDDGLDEDDIAMWYAVHTIVSDESKQILKNQKIMSTLLNRVPAGIGIFIFGEKLGCEYYSDGFPKMAGITRTEMDQKLADNTVLSSLIAPVDFPRVMPVIMENTAKGLPLNLTYRYIYADGSIRWLHLTADKMGERDGEPAYYCVFTTPTEDADLYRSITEDSANGVAVFTRDTHQVLYVNSSAVRFYGLKDFTDITERSIVDILKEHSLEMMLTETDVSKLTYDEFTIFHVERENKFLAIKAKCADWGNIPAYILYITDETVEHEKEIKLERLFDQIPTGISAISVDAHGINQIFVNDGYYKTFGMSEDEYAGYIGYNVINTVHPEDRHIITENLARFYSCENECDFVYRCGITGHENTWIRLVGAVFERDGDDFTLYASFTDVTEQVLAQKRQQELFDTIPSGIMEFFYDGKYAHVISANQTLMGMIGYTEQEFTNIEQWELASVVHPEDYHLLTEARDSIETGKGKTYDFRLLNKKTDMYRWISCDYTITGRTKTEVKVISAFLDIDDKRRLEDASAAKSRFLSRMSHEIRTPINAIMGIAELERQDIENNNISIESLDRYSKETFTASRYLLTLVNDILDTSRIENNQIEIQQHPVDVKQYLADIQTLVEPLIKEKRIHFILNRKTQFHETYIGDSVRVKQIIVNLLNNAFKFTPPEGTVSLTCEAIEDNKDTTTLQFTVQDTGIGMSEEFQKKLFTPFSQENGNNTSPFAGTGLGMSIAKSLAQKMGGDIVCHSVKGEGTTFIATIVVGNTNIEIAPKHFTDEELTRQQELDFDSARILVCEDHPLNQKITKALLERKHCEVDIAEDGVVGVSMFEKHPVGYYAMILMDIRMPNMDGLQATREIRSLDRADAATVPIVAMSANAYEEDVQKSIGAGMNDHLAKPVDAAKLYKAIAHYTAKEDETDDRQLVLVVDDIEVNRAVIVETLRPDYKVLEAENGVQALRKLEQYKDIIAVVTDIQMPVMDGVNLIKNIRKNYQYEDMAILVNTQFGNMEQQKELLSLGADDFVYKPTSPAMLATRLKNVLARRKHIL